MNFTSYLRMYLVDYSFLIFFLFEKKNILPTLSKLNIRIAFQLG